MQTLLVTEKTLPGRAQGNVGTAETGGCNPEKPCKEDVFVIAVPEQRGTRRQPDGQGELGHYQEAEQGRDIVQ